MLAAPSRSPAGESGVSAWVEAPFVRVRLINAGQTGEGAWRVGVEIDMDEGWKTYWRFPGESGVPTVLDWSASRNLAGAEVHWPAPKRFIDAGLTAIGYDKDVLIPVTVTAQQPQSAPRLELLLNFGVCEEICVPVDVTASLDLAVPAPFRQRFAIEGAMDMVPRPLGDGEALATVTAGADSRAPLTVRVDPRDGAPPQDVFVEGPRGWYLAVPKAVAGEGGVAFYRVAVDGMPEGAELVGTELRVTVIYADAAYEQKASVAPGS